MSDNGTCVYTGYKQPSGRISANFFNTSCGKEYVGKNINGPRCKYCERLILDAPAAVKPARK